MLHGRKGRKERLIPSSQDATETSKAKQKIGHIPAFRRATATTTFKPLIFVPGLLASTLARRINNTVTDEEDWEYFSGLRHTTYLPKTAKKGCSKGYRVIFVQAQLIRHP